jgi:hypothetical protein
MLITNLFCCIIFFELFILRQCAILFMVVKTNVGIETIDSLTCSFVAVIVRDVILSEFL